MQTEQTFAWDLEAHLRLVTASFSNAMRDYFSIRTQAVMRIGGMMMEVAVWGILGTLIQNPALQESLNLYGTPDMVTFMLSGLVINRLVFMIPMIHPFFFRSNYKTYHNKPFNIWVVAFAKSIDADFFWRLLGLVIYIFFAALVFKVRINFISVPFWLVILLGVVLTLGLNLFAAGWVVVTKGGQDPITWFYGTTARLFSGELIPITVLPPFLQYVSIVHPRTYVQMLGKQTGIGGMGLSEILPRLGILVMAASVFLILGYSTLRISIRRAKREGTLKWG